VTELASKEQQISDAIYSARFQSHDSAQARWQRELSRTLVAGFFSRGIRADATVLDYGCGKGEFIHAVDVLESLRQTLDTDVELHLAAGIELTNIP
jgi:hypothetical protein